MIYLSTFSWEAFSTLATGASAVAAALFIGLRQTAVQKSQAAIAGRQNRILSRQVRLAELTIRTDLFERRFAVYEATKQYLSAIIRTANHPGDDVERTFWLAKDRAKFLFTQNVQEQLDEIHKRSQLFFALRSIMEYTFQQEKHYGSGNPQLKADYMTWASEKLLNLSAVFGDEMKLSA